MRLLREALGEDAVVISNRAVNDGIELVGAVDDNFSSAPDTLANPPPAISEEVKLLPARAKVDLQDQTSTNNDVVLREIQSMRGMIEDQLAGLAWSEKQKANPVRGHLFRSLIAVGFSPQLAKELLIDLPAGIAYEEGLSFIRAEVVRNLPVLETEDELLKEGGIFALTGPTGVGKTTTLVKLAARYVMRFGTSKIALITTDAYRIGAHEQLKAYGKILGVAVHAVRDESDLSRVLSSLTDKHIILIDTVGKSQRDSTVSEQVRMLASSTYPIKQLLLLNAASHGDTLNEVVNAYKNSSSEDGAISLAGCIFTKVDEAPYPGALIDIAIRHNLLVHYVTSGQKVPEDLTLANGGDLVESVFKPNVAKSLFILNETFYESEPDGKNAAHKLDQQELAAERANSDHLRSQCNHLIRSLSHNANKLTSYAALLTYGKVGFEEALSIWCNLPDTSVSDIKTGADASFKSTPLPKSNPIDYVLAGQNDIDSLSNTDEAQLGVEDYSAHWSNLDTCDERVIH
jgi:flagellar biosynthesis protein FlhF